MRPLINVLFGLSLIVSLSACLAQKEYVEQEEQLNYYKQQALASDSINAAYYSLDRENQQIEIQLKESIRDLEELKATNISLHRSYSELLTKYNGLVNQNQQVLATTSYEKIGLQEELSLREESLAKQQRELANMEYELYQKEAILNRMEYNYTDMKGDLSSKDQKINELKAALQKKEGKMAELRQSVNEVLTGFSNEDLSITERDGKLYLSLSQNLLFNKGSDEIDWQGRRALAQVAEVLKRNQDIDVTVEGHTDTDGTADRNWDLSVMRATTVVKVLTNNGVSPSRVTAAGRGFYAPIAPNNNVQGKALNRRTEIILSPKLDELYDLIKN
ncbi:MAG: cell envelope biogenesis protein OmpA [Saprospiraceae bacterium]|nr:MAG: cell envelope biogenesis protein OmpA [Saprospiraceae bacterium]